MPRMHRICVPLILVAAAPVAAGETRMGSYADRCCPHFPEPPLVQVGHSTLGKGA